MERREAVNDALTKYRELKAALGHVPSSREFYKVCSKRALGAAFGGGSAYSQLQVLAGDKPKEFSSPKSSLDEILTQWGNLARETIRDFNKLPIQDDWARRGLKPTVSGITKTHQVHWSELPRHFSTRFADIDSWADVTSAISTADDGAPDTSHAIDNEQCYVYLMKDLRNGAFKIGIAVNPRKREGTLQSEQPKTELIAAKSYVNRKMALAMEKALHHVYGHKRKRGEWFVLDSTDIAELRATLSDPIG